MGSKVFSSKIRECTALVESQAMRSDIFSYAPKSNGAEDYKLLINEILKDFE
jgi:chromosome partitioning protein